MPSLLLLSPITPAPGGNGLAMRAWALHQALSQYGTLTTVVIPVSGPAPEASPQWLCTEPVSDRAAISSWMRYATGRQWLGTGALPERARSVPPAVCEQLAALTQSANGALQEFDAIVCFRTYLAGAVLAAIEAGKSGGQRPRLIMDADEADHRLLHQRAQHHARLGQPLLAQRYASEAGVAEAFCRSVLPEFDLVTVSSRCEVKALSPLAGNAPVACLPNVISRPSAAGRKPPGRNNATAPDAPEFLFVGNLDYWPNRDAVTWLLNDIWPAVLARTPAARLKIIGAGATELRTQFAHASRVSWLGWVEDLDAEYRGATASLVPLRAGAGTRLKVLEAFAYGVPVVGTTTGLQGLGVKHQKQALLAETSAGLVDQLELLVTSPKLQTQLSGAALDHLVQHFTPGAFAARLTQLLNKALAN